MTSGRRSGDRAVVARAGFTLAELMIAMVLMSFVATFSIRSVGPVQSRLSVRSARAAVGSVHARARALAAERRVLTTFGLDAVRDSVWVSVGDSLVTGLNVRSRFGVDIDADLPALTLCLTSGGTADRACNSFLAPVDIRFESGEQQLTARLRTLGHLAMDPVGGP